MSVMIASRPYTCIYCGGPIVKGESYIYHQPHNYHNECDALLAEKAPDDFEPYKGQMPDRVRAIVESRKSEATKQRKSRGVISYSERERFTLDDADEDVQSLMDRDMGASG